MIARIVPSQAVGVITAPPSKSMAHRALLAAALTSGSRVENVAYSQDIEATLACLRALGATVIGEGDTLQVGQLTIEAIPDGAVLPCHESGSTLRFLLPLCMLAGKEITLTGSKRLFERSLSVYEDIARVQGIRWNVSTDSVTVCGCLSSGNYAIPGNISSQFITGLLYALPLLEGDSHLTILGKLESAPYIDLTLQTLGEFGVAVLPVDKGFFIPGGQRPMPHDYRVEGDCSNAAFLEGLNMLGGSVKVNGLSSETCQGDRVYRDMYRSLAAGKREFDLADCPDLGPVMFAMAAAKGGATFTGTARLRIKESDRSAAMATELAKFGIKVSVEDNRVMVHPGELRRPCAPLCGHNDHRIVMSLALLCTVTGGEITDAEAVAKSYPEFFEVLKSLQIGLTLHDS